MYIRRRRPESSRTNAAPAPGSTFTAEFAATVDAINRRVWASGRTEWNAEDNALAERELCRRLRKMPPPFPDVADRIEGKPSAVGDR